jgi:hypothetical protein
MSPDYDEINRLTREAACDYLNEYYLDDAGNRTKPVRMNAVCQKKGQYRIISKPTSKESGPTQVTGSDLHNSLFLDMFARLWVTGS